MESLSKTFPAGLESPAVSKHKLNAVPQLSTVARYDYPVVIHVSRAPVNMCVSQFDSQGAAPSGIEFHDAAQIQNKICGTRVSVGSAAARHRSDRRERLAITVYARPRLSENAEVISPDSPFNSQQTLKNLSAIVRPGVAGIARKIQNISVQIKHFIKTPGRIRARTGFRPHCNRTVFTSQNHGGKQRPQLDSPRHFRFAFIFPEFAGAVGDAEAQPRGVLDLSGSSKR